MIQRFVKTVLLQ